MGSVFVLVMFVKCKDVVLGFANLAHMHDIYVYPGRTTTLKYGNGFRPEVTTTLNFTMM